MHYYVLFWCFNVVGKIILFLRWFGKKKYRVPLVNVFCGRRQSLQTMVLTYLSLGSSTLSRGRSRDRDLLNTGLKNGKKNIPLLGTLTRNVWRTREHLKFSTEETKSHLVYSWRSTNVYLDGRHKEQGILCVVFVLKDKRWIRISQLLYYANVCVALFR